MATLVLTTLGGAVGGPVGAALGAIIGQQVDRSVLFPARARQGPRLTDLAIQTSRYGAPIPRVFGRMRVAGVVIWATDLIETRANSRAGKGQPTTTIYSYAASFAVALSGRAIRDVGRIWAEGKLLRGAAGDWKTSTIFRLHRGSEAQLPDPLIASAEGAAPAHRGMAYAVFENLQLADFGNRIPSLTFEVIADEAPLAVGAIARELGGDALGDGGATDTIDGFAASGDSVAGALEVLATVAGGWFVPADGVVALTSQTPPPMTLEGEGAVSRSRHPLETVPVRLHVQHHDAARDYQVGVQQARRPGAGWRDEAIEVPGVLPAAQAKAIAEATLHRREQAREAIELLCDSQALPLAPGSAVTCAALPGTWRVTRVSVEGWAVTLSLTPLHHAVAQREADPGRAVLAADAVPGRTFLHAVELPSLDGTVNTAPQLAVLAAGTASGWRRAALMQSRDAGATWDNAGATALPAIMGMLDAPLPRAPATLIDMRHRLDVVLAHDGMALESVSPGLLDRGANLALVGDELIQFHEAVQVAPCRWRLSTLLRGRHGSAPMSHAAGARFVLLEAEAIAWLPLANAGLGGAAMVIASGIGDMDEPVVATATVSGASIAPPAPVALCAAAQADGSVTLRWRRRTRGNGTWRDAQDVPLVEESERYSVRWTSAAGERAMVVATPHVTLDAAARGPGTITVQVAQIGTHATSTTGSITIEGDQG